MATSGLANFNPTIMEILEEACERAGFEMRTGYDLKTGRRSFDFLTAEWGNLGINMWCHELGTLALVDGTATYNLPADTMDILDGSIRQNSGNVTTQFDLGISRMSMTSYLQMPNKLIEARPYSFMVTRGTALPTITFYPIPDATNTYTFVYTRLRRIHNAGTSAEYTADVPYRFLPALTSGLAYHIACKRVASLPLVPSLKERYQEDMELAMSEDIDRSTTVLVPWMGRV